MLNNLIQLDYDAIDAYDAAIDRIDSPEYKARLREFREDHARHTRDLGAVVTQLGGKSAQQGGAKSMLTRGKVMMADLMGDTAILQAMRSNEEDTNTAYERAVKGARAGRPRRPLCAPALRTSAATAPGSSRPSRPADGEGTRSRQTAARPSRIRRSQDDAYRSITARRPTLPFR